MRRADVFFYTFFAPALIAQQVAIQLSDLIELVEYRFFKKQDCPSMRFPWPEPTKEELPHLHKRWLSDWFYNVFAFPFQTSRGQMTHSFPLSCLTWALAIIFGAKWLLSKFI